MPINPKMANRECCDLIFCDYVTGAPFLKVDYAQTTTTDLTGEVTYATGGRGNPRRISFHGEKAGTIAFSTQIAPFKLYSLMTGAALESNAKFIAREVLTAATNKITLSKAPASGGVTVFAVDDDFGTPLTVTVSGTEVTLPESSTGQFIAYYLESITENVKRLNIKSTTFPKAFRVYGETYMKTEDDEIVPYKLVAYKCVPQPNMTLTMANSGDPNTLEFTADLLADENDDMLDMILIEDDVA